MGSWPDAVPFPLVDGAGSPALDELVGGPAAAHTAVALVVAPRARASGWGRRAAIGIARRWTGPRRVLLVDLDLESPSLHHVAGVSNDEGIIDVLEYGVSLGRVIRPARDAAFDLIPAGAFAPDPGAILRHDGWISVLLEAAARRATLLTAVPIDADGAGTAIERAGAVIVIAEPGEERDVVARLPHLCSVLAVLTPAEAAAAEPTTASKASPQEPQAHAPRMSDEEFERIRLPKDRLSRDALIRELRDRHREERLAAQAEAVLRARVIDVDAAARPSPAPAAPEEPAPVEVQPSTPAASDPVWGHDSAPSLTHERVQRASVSRPPAVQAARALHAGHPKHTEHSAQIPLVAKKRRRHRRRSATAAWAASVLLLVGLAGAAWYFFGWRLTPAEAGAAGTFAATEEAVGDTAADSAASAPALLPANLRFQVALPYVVAVAAYRDLGMALQREADLIEIEPQLRFHIETVVRDGGLFHHVMAGPVRDSASALALRDTLIVRGHKTASTPTDIRSTPYAFLIGDYGSQVEAHQQREVLRSLDLAGYVVDAAAADGRPLYRLYVGGFGSEAEAHVVGVQLRAAGLQDSLVTRTGSIINDLSNSSDS